MIGQIYDVEYVCPFAVRIVNTFQKALDKYIQHGIACDNHTTPDPFSYMGIGHFYLL